MRIHHNVIIHKTEFPNAKILKQKIEQKFNVIVSETISLIEDDPHSSFSQQNTNARIKYNYTKQDFNAHLEKDYEIQITGTQVNEAIKYIQELLDDYSCIDLDVPYLKG